MSTINRGFTFTTGVFEQASYTALHALVGSALVTAIPLSEFATTTRPHQISATAPSSDQGDGSLWFDSTLNVYRVKGLAGWNGALDVDANNQTGATIPKGSWVVNSGANSRVAPGATHRWPEVLGVLTATMADASHDLVLKKGIQLGLVLGPVTAGDYLVLAGSTFTTYGAGYAVSATLGGSGSMTFTAGIKVGIALANISAATTGLVTCMVF